MSSDIMLTYLGHSAVKINDNGKIMLIDPWITTNPQCPQDLKTLSAVDLILVTHSHFDHLGDTLELAEKYKPKIISVFELCHWMESKGVHNTIPMNKGGTNEQDGLSITMVPAEHSSGILEGGAMTYGGEPVGYVLKFSSGLTIYHAGDTHVFSDMNLIRELYHPDIALLPIGGHFTMGPKEAAHACELLGTKIVIPIHYGTFPVLTGTPEQLAERTKHLPAVEIKKMHPGETWRIVDGKI